MPANPESININLLQRMDGERTAVGRITTWAVTYGRYIMIGTEIVVLLAFIARFSLDRKLTDLKEEIGQKQVILVANAPFEQEVKNIQDRLTQAKKVLTDQTKPTDLLTFLQTNLPPDVALISVDYSSKKLAIEATAKTTEGFSQFITSLTKAPGVSDIEIGDIQKQPEKGIMFKISATIEAPKAQK
ncbi:PilN domain-containing protein [Candidatus Gottesmanbacteria bacterium]|nr:PilN domain-containing protein [Candidatus Gottesmanbacteria bacterium]